MADHEVVRAINDAHRRILAAASGPDDQLVDVIRCIYDRPYAYECACALANSATAAGWFVGACTHGMWPLLRWLVFMYGDANGRYGYLALDTACLHGHESIAKWLIDMSWYTVDDIKHMIWAPLAPGRFRLVKYMFSRHERVFREQNILIICKRCAFTWACKYRCIWFIRWLDKTYGLTQDDARHREMYAFMVACRYGHWRLARWMTTRFDLTRAHIRAADHLPLINACSGGQLHIVRWLVERFRLGAQDMRARHNQAFVYACEHGHLELVQWMTDRFRLTTRDANSRHNHALLGVMDKGNIVMARWLIARFGLGRDGARVGYYHSELIPYQTKIPADTQKWFIATFELYRRQKDDWHRLIIDAASYEDHVAFAWWMVKKFGIMPCDIKPALDMYVRRTNITAQRIECAQRWFDAYAVEW